MAVTGGGEHAGIPSGADPCLVHVVHHLATGESQHLDGTPIPNAEAERIFYHASTVTRTHGPDGDLLHLGRAAGTGTPIKNELSMLRRGPMRFPGCDHRISTMCSPGGKADPQTASPTHGPLPPTAALRDDQ